MEMPKLRPRPKSTQVCTNFRGLDRRPGASNKYSNKSWHMGWHDERNLSSDRFPRLSVRPARGQVDEIDGNMPAAAIVAMCGGDRPVLLDENGVLYCGGRTLQLPFAETTQKTWEAVCNHPESWCYVGNGVDANIDPTGPYSIITWMGNPTVCEFTFIGPEDPDHPNEWSYVQDGETRYVLLEELIPEIHWCGTDPEDLLAEGFTPKITIRLNKADSAYAGADMVRMGANVIVFPKDPNAAPFWVNVVKLASGAEMEPVKDYGRIDCAVEVYLSTYETTLTMCDIDGNPYSGVVVSATEPQQEGYWLDISGDKPKLQEWSVSQSTWVTLTSTYVKIEGIPLIGAREWDSSPLQKGDAARFSVTDLDAGTDPLVVQLLNGTHYLYDAGSPALAEPYMIVAGILPADSVTVDSGYAVITRSIPEMDFVVEAQNRLWGCRYSEEDQINEIYASKLGDFRNWEVFQGLSTDSWRSSRGTAAPFTGAAALGGYPLFFREDSLEKVFPSSSGAHQIATYSLEGVQQGSHGSMVVIDERLFYKSRQGVCVYAGTLPARISEEFGDWEFENATAARHLRKYAICMSRPSRPRKTSHGIVSTSERLCMVYDLDTGDWHVEDECWEGIAITWEDDLYYVKNGEIYSFSYGSGSYGVDWYAESDEMSLELPEHKWITYLRLRFELELDASCRVYISYDGGPWLRKGTLHGNRLHTKELGIWPRRCDHFRLRLEGIGGCELQSLSYRLERSKLGH